MTAKRLSYTLSLCAEIGLKTAELKTAELIQGTDEFIDELWREIHLYVHALYKFCGTQNKEDFLCH